MCGNMVLLMLVGRRRRNKQKSKGHVQWSNRNEKKSFSAPIWAEGVVRISTGFGFSALLRGLWHCGKRFVQQQNPSGPLTAAMSAVQLQFDAGEPLVLVFMVLQRQ